jgi:hypothetical protein
MSLPHYSPEKKQNSVFISIVLAHNKILSAVFCVGFLILIRKEEVVKIAMATNKIRN